MSIFIRNSSKCNRYLLDLNNLTFFNYRKKHYWVLSTHQCHDVICQVPGKIWSNKTGQASQCNSSIILVRATQILKKEKEAQTFKITKDVEKLLFQTNFIHSTDMKQSFCSMGMFIPAIKRNVLQHMLKNSYHGD